MLNQILKRVLYKTNITCILFILSSSYLFSQIPPPPGQPLFKDFYPERDSGIFVSGYSVNYALGNTWNPPLFSYIVDVSNKYGSQGILLVLLDDGTVIKLEQRGYKDTEIIGPNISGSVDFKKIIGDALYTLTTKGVYVTRDGGSTWQLDTAGIGSTQIWDIAIDSAQYIYAAADNGLYIQNPDSNIWHQVTSNVLGLYTSFIKVFIDQNNRIWLAGNSGGIYMSTDKGSTWAIDTTGIGSGFQSINNFGDDYFGNVYATTSNVSFTPNAIFKSSGGTAPWTRIDQGITAITVNQSLINSIGGDSTLYAATSFGLYSSTDQGATWTESNTGIQAETFNGLAQASSGRLITSTALGIFTKEANDTSWAKRFPVNGYEANLPLYQDGLKNLYSIEPLKNSFGNIVKSTDNGTTWAYDTLGISALTKPQLFYVDENGTKYLTGNILNGSIFQMAVYQKKLGGSWTSDTSGLLANIGLVNSIASDQHGYLYISVYWNNSVSSQSQGVARRPINGGAWTIDSTGLPSGFTFFYEMQADKNGMMYGHNYYYLLRRTNSGWVSVPVPNQIPGTYYTAFTFDSSNTLFAALEQYSYSTGKSLGRGIFYTTDQGANWTYAGLDSLAVSKLYSYGNSTYAITDRGIYIVNKNGTTAVKNQSHIPNQYDLFQNYPNPFNPATTINYSIPKTSLVTIKVYDVLGREITTLINEEKKPGNYNLEFNASKLASGIYFYQLHASNGSAQSFISTKKMLLLK